MTIETAEMQGTAIKCEPMEIGLRLGEEEAIQNEEFENNNKLMGNDAMTTQEMPMQTQEMSVNGTMEQNHLNDNNIESYSMSSSNSTGFVFHFHINIYNR